MTASLNIRNASVTDLPALIALDHATFGDKPYPGFFFRQALELWPDFLLVAVNASGLQGYLLAAPSTSPGTAWILSLAVHDVMRGKGVGKALVEEGLEAMQRKSFVTVRLTAHPDSAAIRLYEKLGFRERGADPDYFQDGESRILLERILSA